MAQKELDDERCNRSAGMIANTPAATPRAALPGWVQDAKDALAPNGESARVEAAEALAQSLMAEHGLSNWSLIWQDSRSVAGRCVRPLRWIMLSRPIIECNEEAQIRDVILHEIAHALTAGHHNEVWRAVARRIGGSGEIHPRLRRPEPIAVGRSHYPDGQKEVEDLTTMIARLLVLYSAGAVAGPKPLKVEILPINPDPAKHQTFAPFRVLHVHNGASGRSYRGLRLDARYVAAVEAFNATL